MSPIEEDPTCVFGLGSPPGTGKTLLGPQIAAELSRRLITPWVFLDNEWGFTPEMRVECSVRSGLALDTPEFARAFNKWGQIAFQATIAKIAAQGINVLFVAPMEDLTAPVGDRNVYEVLKSQFADFDFRFQYLLLWPGDVPSEKIADPAIMEPVETEIRRRLIARGAEGSPQRMLDQPKIGDANYYQKRAMKVLHSASKLDLNIVQASIGEAAEPIVQRIVDAFLN